LSDLKINIYFITCTNFYSIHICCYAADSFLFTFHVLCAFLLLTLWVSCLCYFGCKSVLPLLSYTLFAFIYNLQEKKSAFIYTLQKGKNSLTPLQSACSRLHAVLTKSIFETFFETFFPPFDFTQLLKSVVISPLNVNFSLILEK